MCPEAQEDSGGPPRSGQEQGCLLPREVTLAWPFPDTWAQVPWPLLPPGDGLPPAHLLWWPRSHPHRSPAAIVVGRCGALCQEPVDLGGRLPSSPADVQEATSPQRPGRGTCPLPAASPWSEPLRLVLPRGRVSVSTHPAMGT